MPAIKLQPQPGPQWAFHKSPADIAILGGGAGGGKTHSLLVEPLRHIEIPNFGGCIFRKSVPQIQKQGALWDASKKIYPHFGGFGIKKPYQWTFKNDVRISFEHCQNENALDNFDGSEICYLGFDQLEQFSEKEFWHLTSRCRSTCGVSPYIRATINPDPDHFSKKLIEWWLLPNGDYADPKKSGIIRYLLRLDDEIIWGESIDALRKKYKDLADFAQSFTFIPALVTDNKILLEKDPRYLGKLHALPFVKRERLLHGNWKIREVSGNLFRREWCEVVDATPTDITWLRYWDLAGTKKDKSKKSHDPDRTGGLKMGMDPKGRVFIGHLSHFTENPLGVEKNVLNMASSDGQGTHVVIEIDPAQAGKFQIATYISKLAGYKVGHNRPAKNKIERFYPVSAQCEQGNVKVLRGAWNEKFFDELENFPEGTHDDIADCLSGGYISLCKILGKIP